MAETKDVAVKVGEYMPVVGADQFDLGDNMEGVEAQLPQIKILHQAEMFLLPDGSKVQTFTGVIIDMNRTNAYWIKSYENGSTDLPDCFSLNGVTPDMSSQDIQSESGSCVDCPMNQFGSCSSGGKGKACRNNKRVHVLVGGSMMPMRLTSPPTSIKSIDLYVSLLTSQSIPYQLVETEFSLNQISDTVSEVILRKVGPASIVKTVEDAQKLKALITQWRGIMRGEIITGNET